MKCFQCQWVRARKIATSVMVRGFLMKNSYQGYWFSCETTYSDDIGTRKWTLLLINKSNGKINTIGLDNKMTMGEVLKLAYEEIEKLNKENK